MAIAVDESKMMRQIKSLNVGSRFRALRPRRAEDAKHISLGAMQNNLEIEEVYTFLGLS